MGASVLYNFSQFIGVTGSNAAFTTNHNKIQSSDYSMQREHFLAHTEGTELPHEAVYSSPS